MTRKKSPPTHAAGCPALSGNACKCSIPHDDASQSQSKSQAKLLTAGELVERWRGAVSVRTLDNWRSKGKGPAAVKIGQRPLYPLDAVIAYERTLAAAHGRKS